MYLAGDIGGTKTHLALFENDKLIEQKKFSSGDYETLYEIVDGFLSGRSVIGACFGIAGPIKNNKCSATNLPWVIDANEFSVSYVSLINDLEANAYGIKELSNDDFTLLNKGNGVGNMALISPGTGLGEAGLFFTGKKHVPFACEGGHCDFSPRNEEEIDLYRYLEKKHGHVSFERVLSGPGLYNLYRFLIDTDREHDRDVITNKDGAGPSKVSERAIEGGAAELRAIELFTSILGGEAGNLALKFLSLGGLFIGGGIVPKLGKLFDHDLFMHAFCAKGRFHDLLRGIEVKIIQNQETALLGAKHYAKSIIGA